MKKQLMLWGFYALTCFPLHAQPKPVDHKKRLEVIHTNIYTHFFDSASGLFRETTDSARNENPHSYLWPLCALLQAANEMEQLQPSKAYMEPVMKAIQQQVKRIKTGKSKSPNFAR